jgi:hypothetical protein
MKTIELNGYDLNDLPDGKGLYAIYSRKNGSLGNCIYVGETENIRESTIKHLSSSEENECLRTFAQSKIIILRFELMPNSDKEQRLDIAREWTDRFHPRCHPSPLP